MAPTTCRATKKEDIQNLLAEEIKQFQEAVERKKRRYFEHAEMFGIGIARAVEEKYQARAKQLDELDQKAIDIMYKLIDLNDTLKEPMQKFEEYLRLAIIERDKYLEIEKVIRGYDTQVREIDKEIARVLEVRNSVNFMPGQCFRLCSFAGSQVG
jgi:hypothetical protein